MKTCVHCAEQIQDDAAVCRYCNRPVAVGAARITHRGNRYGIGSLMDDRYGVWDLTTGELATTQTFEHTEDGWARAWKQYQDLEGRGSPVAAHSPAGPAQTSGKAVASLVLGLLWIYGIGSILALVFGFLGKNEIDNSGGRLTGTGMAVAGIVLGFVGLGLLVLLIIWLVAQTPGFEGLE